MADTPDHSDDEGTWDELVEAGSPESRSEGGQNPGQPPVDAPGNTPAETRTVTVG